MVNMFKARNAKDLLHAVGDFESLWSDNRWKLISVVWDGEFFTAWLQS